MLILTAAANRQYFRHKVWSWKKNSIGRYFSSRESRPRRNQTNFGPLSLLWCYHDPHRAYYGVRRSAVAGTSCWSTGLALWGNHLETSLPLSLQAHPSGKRLCSTLYYSIVVVVVVEVKVAGMFEMPCLLFCHYDLDQDKQLENRWLGGKVHFSNFIVI